MTRADDFLAHVATGVSTVARCWRLTRRDGAVLGFTDHDRDIAFGGVSFRADTGLTARALQQTTGLAIDNAEALGALSAAAVTEADIRAGRYDGAEVVAWLVNWADPEARLRVFRGTLGEITRAGGGFRAELVGIAEALNRVQGRVFQAPCGAVLGDAACRVDLTRAEFSGTGTVVAAQDQKLFKVSGLAPQTGGWFERGRLVVLSGAAAGLVGVIRADRLSDGLRALELWESLRAELAPGDAVRLEAGCDRRPETCREKFGNFLNFRGFPDIPGEDRQLSVPVRANATVPAGGEGGK